MRAGWRTRGETIVVVGDEPIDLSGIAFGRVHAMGLDEAEEVRRDWNVERGDVREIVDIERQDADGNGFGRVGLRFGVVDAAEGLSETKPVGGDCPFGESVGLQIAEVARFGDVACEVVSKLANPMDGSDVNARVIADCPLPELEQLAMGEVGPVDDRMKVGVPAFGLGVERDFDGVDPSGDAISPFGATSHRREATTQELDLFGQARIRRADCEGEEARSFHQPDQLGNSGR